MQSLVPPHIKIVVFDAYGTLFDVHSAVGRHIAKVGPEAERFSELWRTKQLEYSWVLSLAGRYEPFWTLTERALDFALARFPSVDAKLKPQLLEAYQTLAAYREVHTTLNALKSRGLRTAILSNGDPAMLAEAVGSAGIADYLDAVLSVDQAKVFKTSPATYDLVLQAFPVKAEEVVFVSSNRWDIAGAAAFGFTPIWVNRHDAPDEYPDLPPQTVISALDRLV